MRDPGREDETRGRTFAEWLARLSAIIMILPASMFAGWLLGYYLLDRLLQAFPWGTILGTMLGAGAGFYEIVRMLMPRQDGKTRSDGKS